MPAGDLWKRLKGSFASTFQLGKGGPLLKNASGVVEHRNAADAAYAIARGADPVGVDDLITKRWGLANLGGSGTPPTEVDIDFGNFPSYGKAFTIIDASVSAASVIVATPSGNNATGGGGADENEMDGLILAAFPGTGQFILYAVPAPGPVAGKRKIQYKVS